MSDRVYLRVAVYVDDVDAFWEAVGEEPADVVARVGTSPVFVVEEANYGWYDRLQDAATASTRFFGHHARGHEIDRGAFAAIDGAFHFVTTNGELSPIVPVDDDGVICPAHLQEVLYYQTAYRRVSRLCESALGELEEVLR